MTTRVPLRSAASKDTVSSSRSMTVCSRRAPIFSVLLVDLESHLREPLHAASPRIRAPALRWPASAVYWRHSEASGSVKIRTKSSTTSGSSSTRIGKPSLQLGNQVRGLGHVKGAGGDEQHMIGLHRTVLGVDRAALDQRQEVALHALARHVGARGLLAAGDLVDLVDEHDAVLLGVLDGADLELLLVDHLRGFLVHQQLQRLLDLELALPGPAAAQILEHALELLGHFLHAGRRHDFHAHGHRAHFDLDFPVVQHGLRAAFSESAAGCRCRGVPRPR